MYRCKVIMDMENSEDNPTYIETILITEDPIALQEQIESEEGDSLISFEVVGEYNG